MPILRHELTLIARRQHVTLWRCVFALLLAIFAGLMYYGASRDARGNFGRREVAAYDFRARVNPGQPVYVHIEAPTWNRAGEPADQGVRVERMQVQPAAGSGRQEVE